MQVTFALNKCMVCDGIRGLTTHHAIPKHLKPKNNLLVPVCGKCHDNINIEDTAGLNNFMFKLIRETEDLRKKVNTLSKHVDARNNKDKELFKNVDTRM